jgi:hypothetical protein
MKAMWRLVLVFLCLCAILVPSYAADLDRDFSGTWNLVPESSNLAALRNTGETQLIVMQDDAKLRCSRPDAAGTVTWSYDLTGSESKYRIGQENRNSVIKWEGAALLVNTIASGPESYTVMDRWKLSADRGQLTITRQVVRANGQAEGTLVYRRAGWARATAPALPAVAAPGSQPAPQMALAPRTPAAAAPNEFTVKAGTHILLSLVNSLNAKKSRAGDHVYLRTAVPVAVSDRVIIPRGSDVAGTLVESQPAKGKKGELFIRFDSLTLPNGVTRDLLSRPPGSSEGKLASGDKGDDVRHSATGAGVGAAVGGIAGAAAGHPGMGLGIGGIAGAAAGLGGLFGKKPDPVLPQGTTMEMVLDRDLAFKSDEIR